MIIKLTLLISILIQIDENKAVWIAKKYIHPQLCRLTPAEKSKGIKIDVNNHDYILKRLYTLGLVEDYMYEIMTSIKDAIGKYVKTQEVLSGKTLTLQVEKYSDQCYKKYLAEKQKINKPKASNSIQCNQRQHLNIKR